MTNVLRRIDSPTRYGGLPLKAWLAITLGLVAAALLVKVAHAPILPTLVGLSWLVAAPGVVLVMWAHQQGVSVPTLMRDFARHALRRNRVLTHDPRRVLRGGIVIEGRLPQTNEGVPEWLDASLPEQDA